MREDKDEVKAKIGKEAAVTDIHWEKGMFGILWLGQCSCFVCLQTSLWSDLVFYLIHYGHRVALSVSGFSDIVYIQHEDMA